MLPIGNNIRKYRKMLKLSQEKLAELSGINEKSIHFYESGKRQVPTKYLIAIAKTLGVGIEKLIEDEKEAVSEKKTPNEKNYESLEEELIALIENQETECQKKILEIIHKDFDEMKKEVRREIAALTVQEKVKSKK